MTSPRNIEVQRSSELAPLQTASKYWEEAKSGNFNEMWKTAKEKPADTAILVAGGMTALYATKKLIDWFSGDDEATPAPKEKGSWIGSMAKWLGVGALGVLGFNFLKDKLSLPDFSSMTDFAIEKLVGKYFIETKKILKLSGYATPFMLSFLNYNDFVLLNQGSGSTWDSLSKRFTQPINSTLTSMINKEDMQKIFVYLKAKDGKFDKSKTLGDIFKELYDKGELKELTRGEQQQLVEEGSGNAETDLAMRVNLNRSPEISSSLEKIKQLKSPEEVKENIDSFYVLQTELTKRVNKYTNSSDTYFQGVGVGLCDVLGIQESSEEWYKIQKFMMMAGDQGVQMYEDTLNIMNKAILDGDYQTLFDKKNDFIKILDEIDKTIAQVEAKIDSDNESPLQVEDLGDIINLILYIPTLGYLNLSVIKGAGETAACIGAITLGASSLYGFLKGMKHGPYGMVTSAILEPLKLSFNVAFAPIKMAMGTAMKKLQIAGKTPKLKIPFKKDLFSPFKLSDEYINSWIKTLKGIKANKDSIEITDKTYETIAKILSNEDFGPIRKYLIGTSGEVLRGYPLRDKIKIERLNMFLKTIAEDDQLAKFLNAIRTKPDIIRKLGQNYEMFEFVYKNQAVYELISQNLSNINVIDDLLEGLSKSSMIREAFVSGGETAARSMIKSLESTRSLIPTVVKSVPLEDSILDELRKIVKTGDSSEDLFHRAIEEMRRRTGMPNIRPQFAEKLWFHVLEFQKTSSVLERLGNILTKPVKWSLNFMKWVASNKPIRVMFNGAMVAADIYVVLEKVMQAGGDVSEIIKLWENTELSPQEIDDRLSKEFNDLGVRLGIIGALATTTYIGAASTFGYSTAFGLSAGSSGMLAAGSLASVVAMEYMAIAYLYDEASDTLDKWGTKIEEWKKMNSQELYQELLTATDENMSWGELYLKMRLNFGETTNKQDVFNERSKLIEFIIKALIAKDEESLTTKPQNPTEAEKKSFKEKVNRRYAFVFGQLNNQKKNSTQSAFDTVSNINDLPIFIEQSKYYTKDRIALKSDIEEVRVVEDKFMKNLYDVSKAQSNYDLYISKVISPENMNFEITKILQNCELDDEAKAQIRMYFPQKIYIEINKNLASNTKPEVSLRKDMYIRYHGLLDQLKDKVSNYDSKTVTGVSYITGNNTEVRQNILNFVTPNVQEIAFSQETDNLESSHEQAA